MAAKLIDVQRLVDQTQEAFNTKDWDRGRKTWQQIKEMIRQLDLSPYKQTALTNSIYVRLSNLDYKSPSIKVDELLNNDTESEMLDTNTAWLPY